MIDQTENLINQTENVIDFESYDVVLIFYNAWEADYYFGQCKMQLCQHISYVGQNAN